MRNLSHQTEIFRWNLFYSSLISIREQETLTLSHKWIIWETRRLVAKHAATLLAHVICQNQRKIAKALIIIVYFYTLVYTLPVSLIESHPLRNWPTSRDLDNGTNTCRNQNITGPTVNNGTKERSPTLRLASAGKSVFGLCFYPHSVRYPLLPAPYIFIHKTLTYQSSIFSECADTNTVDRDASLCNPPSTHSWTCCMKGCVCRTVLHSMPYHDFPIWTHEPNQHYFPSRLQYKQVDPLLMSEIVVHSPQNISISLTFVTSTSFSA